MNGARHCGAAALQGGQASPLRGDCQTHLRGRMPRAAGSYLSSKRDGKTEAHRPWEGQRRKTIVILSVFILAAIIAIVPNSRSSSKGLEMPVQGGRIRAPELNGARGWLNTDKPLTLSALKGKVVLLDFWTYGCINCMHIIPDLKRLEKKYPNELVVIGVHSAKYENEKSEENIRRIIVRYELEHPVVNDADFAIWQSYGVHAWPTQV